ncbi:MAG TPA: hypothetical protein VIY72_11260 [Acidimicrobiales bacterium]
MADLPPQYADDELLHVQLEARERASKEDAAIQRHLRSSAAARALGMPLPPPLPAPPDPPTYAADEPADAVAPVDPADEVLIEAQRLADEAREATASDRDMADAPAPTEAREVDVDPPELDQTPDTDSVDDEPPGVVVPRGGPAAVTTGVLAAAAAQRPKVEKPLLELRPTALATEIDRIGDQLVVMTDRIELRDRNGGLRRQLALADIQDVSVERRLTSAVLHLTSRTGADMVVKGLRPDLAEEAQAAVMALLPEVPLINSIEEKALMHSILALHRAGVLNDTEMAAKTSLVARMAGH